MTRSTMRAAMLVPIVALAACSLDSLAGAADVPPELNDPTATETPEGAVAAYHGALRQLRIANARYVIASGLLADELQERRVGGTSISQIVGLDIRTLPEGRESDNGPDVRAYTDLQRVRGQAAQALGLLRDFAPERPSALRGHLYAVIGYSELMLAELFCSGVPLSTVDYGGDYTLRPGSPTEEVLEHAAALFDTALTLAADSARILQLAYMGRARARLQLGRPDLAAEDATQVGPTFVYAFRYTPTVVADEFMPFVADDWLHTIPDREGGNGLPFRSSGDPRTGVVQVASPDPGQFIFYPAKYATDGTSPVVLASGIEARLIEAEAAVATGDASWLGILNALRTNGTFTTTPNADDPAVTDTLWHAGTGGVDGLPPLADPGVEGRLDLVLRERGFWLFLTGHRQGDLRRLIRNYQRPQHEVYPAGPYGGSNQLYGSDLTAPIPAAERIHNPQFVGCLSRGA